jgi:glycosyltransferase involved in cell wall biosynthesis
MPAGHAPAPAPGVAAALEAMFASLAPHTDVISQHAFDAPAFELDRGFPVLHTIHLPPLVPAVVHVVSGLDPARLATVSNSCRASWKAAGVEIGRVLRNGVPDQPVDDGPVEVMALVAGRISPEKGIEHALQAAHAAGIRVRVAGAAYDPGYEVDLSGAEQLGLLPRDELRRVMGRSAVTVCAVRWDEPFGLVAAEAQMAGCPVAGYRRGALPEVVEDGVSGVLVEPDDIEALTHALQRCVSMDRRAVRSSALRRLGMEQSLDQYEEALSVAAR